jgi:diguanylate cyclase (GGDEF)-like protein/PAS domain S-box-containing protein
MVRDEQQREDAGATAMPEPTQALLSAFGSEFVLVVSPAGEVVGGSHDSMLGYSIDNLGSHVGEYLHPDDLPQVFQVVERARQTYGYRDRLRLRARHADGSWRLLDVAILPPPERGPFRGNAVLRIRDITDEAVWSERAPGEERERFLSLAESLPLGILSADARGWVVFCNDAAQQIFNLPPDQLVGHGWERLIDPADAVEVMSAVRDVVQHGLPQQVMFRIQTGLFARWALAKFVPLGGPDAVTGWIATVDDVTDRRRAESELTHQATHDPLTGLPNRMLLEDRLQQACARLGRRGESLTVMFLDLDGFKDVNDRHGHSTGDQVLVEVANRLRQILRTVDTVARLGGDEFVLFCEGLRADEVDDVVARIKDVLSVPLVVSGEVLRIGASIGVETSRDASMTFDELLTRADQAMYRQKRLR